jgi:uncharacterized protein (DUF433 family)
MNEGKPLMDFIIHMDPVPLRIDADGEVRIGGTRVLMHLVVQSIREGVPPETIVQMYSSLQLADVHAVIAYYLRHKADVDEYLRQRERESEQIRQRNLARFPPDGVRERLVARLEEKERGSSDVAPARG